jgi:hypothetical protein
MDNQPHLFVAAVKTFTSSRMNAQNKRYFKWQVDEVEHLLFLFILQTFYHHIAGSILIAGVKEISF